MQQRPGNAVYGQLVNPYVVGVYPAQLVVNVQSVNAFPQLTHGQWFPFTINPASSGLPDNAGPYPSPGYTERGMCCITSVVGVPAAGQITLTIKPLLYPHSNQDIIVIDVTSRAGEAMTGGGIVNGPLDSSSMTTWENVLSKCTLPGNGPAILWMIEDSFGPDLADAYQSFRNAMYQKYNQSPPAIGLANIYRADSLYTTAGYSWPTMTGVRLGIGHGICGSAVQISGSQQCISPKWLMDGVQFHWLYDQTNGGNWLDLLVDGSIVATVDSSKTGCMYYAMPGGAGYHTVGYQIHSATGGNYATVDSPYCYLNNRNSGLQIWENSHSGQETIFWGGVADGIALCAAQSATNQLTAASGNLPGGIVVNCLVTGEGVPPGTFTTGTGGSPTISLNQNVTLPKAAMITFHHPGSKLLPSYFNNINTSWNPGYPYLAQVCPCSASPGSTAITAGSHVDFLQAGIAVGHYVVGGGYPPGTTVLSVNSSSIQASVGNTNASSISNTLIGFQRCQGASLALNGSGGSGSQAPAALLTCMGTNDVLLNDSSDYGVTYRQALDGIQGYIQTFGGVPMVVGSQTIQAPTSLALTFPYATNNNSRGDYSPWEVQAFDFCLQNGAALFDYRTIIPDITSSSSIDAMSWTVDGLHPSPICGRTVIAPGLLRIFDIGSTTELLDQSGVPALIIASNQTSYWINGHEVRLLFASNSAVTLYIPGPQDLYNAPFSKALPDPSNSLGGSYAAWAAQPQLLNIEPIVVVQYGTGAVTPTVATGSTCVLRGDVLATTGQYTAFKLTPISATEWLVTTESPAPTPCSTVSGTSYTPVASDAGTHIDTTNGSNIAITAPPNVFVKGQFIEWQQLGTGKIQFTQGAGVTINWRQGFTNAATGSAGQYAILRLWCDGPTTFTLSGDVA